MAQSLQVNDSVYVPCSKLKGANSSGVALYKTRVLEIDGHKVKLGLRDGSTSDWIGNSLLHKEVGILVINIGDFQTEHGLLDPLAKSVAQFCRLLVPDDQIRQIRVRSLDELKKVWRLEQGVYSHVIWIAHGSQNGMQFGVDGWVSAEALSNALRIHGAPKKIYLSLCCQTGYKSFGGLISKAPICGQFIGPFHSVQGAAASQFCQSFLAYHLLDGKTVGVAFNQARSNVPGGRSFRFWKDGVLKAGPKK